MCSGNGGGAGNVRGDSEREVPKRLRNNKEVSHIHYRNEPVKSPWTNTGFPRVFLIEIV
jgi:hypothetical protein